jgi:hypothetical protein
VKIELNSDAIDELLKSDEVQDELERRARLIAEHAGPGMEVEVTVGATRARASVRTGTVEAKLAEARDRALTTALDAGRG